MPYLTPNGIGTLLTTRLISVSSEPLLLGAIDGAISQLSNPANWEKYGDMTPDECADYFQEVFWDYMSSGLVGLVLPYANGALPAFALACDGATYNRVDYPLLYAALDTVFIIDADTFNVPDLRDRVALGAGSVHSVGSNGGADSHTLSEAEMPIHSHADSGHYHAEIIATPTLIAIGAGVPAPSGLPGISTTGVGFASIGTAGSGSAHNNLQPYIALPMCIVCR